MVRLDWSIDDRNGVTLVELQAINDSPVDRHVRIANRLDGSVWPPRRDGLPEPGWDADGFEGVVESADRLSLGYASPAEPAEPPAEIVHDDIWSSGTTDWNGETPFDFGRNPTPTTVVQTLGDPRPPRIAVPDPTIGTEGNSAESGVLPRSVREWLSGVVSRLDRCERAASVSTLSDAARAVDDAGGLDELAACVSRIDADYLALRELEGCSSRLADRVERVRGDVPLATFRTLA